VKSFMVNVMYLQIASDAVDTYLKHCYNTR